MEKPGVISFGGNTAEAASRRVASEKKSISDYQEQFVKLINKERLGKSPVIVASLPATKEEVVEDHGVNYWKVPMQEIKRTSNFLAESVGEKENTESVNVETTLTIVEELSAWEEGLDTSKFTICTRIRPLLEDEKSNPSSEGNENFECIFRELQASSEDKRNVTEPCVVYKPKISIMGKPKLEKESFVFDRTFDQSSSNEDVYKVCRPIVSKVIAGQVGTIFAFGQTGSGKTFTMNSVMDSLAEDLFSEKVESVTKGLAIEVSFSYMELLGQEAKDCLSTEESRMQEVEPIQIGELLDGRIGIRNLSVHTARNREDFLTLISQAKSTRSTAATERNSESSRSHGVGIVRISYLIDGVVVSGMSQGTLYLIDLAGSERMADKKSHTDARLEETKAINLSLMCLKECIRARTIASLPGRGSETHIPYRRSKLTLLMKDCFEISSPRISSTLVISHVTPLARDVPHSLNTLSYTASLKVALVASEVKSGPKMQIDQRDPAYWDWDRTSEWLRDFLGSSGTSNAEDIVTALEPANRLRAGFSLCQMSVIEIFALLRPLGFEIELAKALNEALWTMVCDAKMRRRRPNGTLITPEEEALEIEKVREATLAKAALWQAREAQLKSDF